MLHQEFKENIMHLIKQINNSNMAEVRELYKFLMYPLICYNEHDNYEHMTILYKLILYVHTTQPEMAYTMLCGLLDYDAHDIQHKPLIDHLVIEIFNALLKNTGWSILYPFMNVMQNNLPPITLTKEPLFNHILKCIVIQLHQDAINPNPSETSNLCHHLPREKSYKWRKFPYQVAISYYYYPSFNAAPIMNQKILRKCLMEYRKLVSFLRRNNIQHQPQPDTDTLDTKSNSILCENCDELSIILNSPEYTWLEQVIQKIMSPSPPLVVTPLLSATPEPAPALPEPAPALPEPEPAPALPEPAPAPALPEPAPALPEPAPALPEPEPALPVLEEKNTDSTQSNSTQSNSTQSNSTQSNSTQSIKENSKSWFNFLGW